MRDRDNLGRLWLYGRWIYKVSIFFRNIDLRARGEIQPKSARNVFFCLPNRFSVIAADVCENNDIGLEDMVRFNDVVFRKDAHDLHNETISMELRGLLQHFFLLENRDDTPPRDILHRSIRQHDLSLRARGLRQHDATAFPKNRCKGANYTRFPACARNGDNQRNAIPEPSQ